MTSDVNGKSDVNLWRSKRKQQQQQQQQNNNGKNKKRKNKKNHTQKKQTRNERLFLKGKTQDYVQNVEKFPSLWPWNGWT